MPIRIDVNGGLVPILAWTDSVEQNAIEQAEAIVRKLPLHKHLALMPDVHMGYGMPIGGVMPLIGGISPMAVGYDIGCGMLAIQTNLTAIDIEVQKEIYGEIRKKIPVGFNKKDEDTPWQGFGDAPQLKPVLSELPKARQQLGTLGGGNHFIEFQKGSDGYIWVMLHSGSRHLGHEIASFYHKIAKSDGVVKVDSLPYFQIGTENADEYEAAMKFALAFALENRNVMSDIIMNILDGYLGAEWLHRINIHHNYAVREKHFGEDVIIHRKGATLATQGSAGIIPGSQGTKSYIVRGRGNADSFNSCSHGSGRVMSRTKAKKTLTKEQVIEAMGGLLWDADRSSLDEAPQAYKDIAEVMHNQSDLVDVEVELTPYQIAAIKG